MGLPFRKKHDTNIETIGQAEQGDEYISFPSGVRKAKNSSAGMRGRHKDDEDEQATAK